MTDTLRAGVVGAGVFGGHHARKWARLDGARLTAIFDTHPERARALAEVVGGEAFTDMDAFFEAVDVISVATPATSHGSVALAALKAGKSIYVEKPLAVTLEEADAIGAEAAKRGLTVACGFTERVAIFASRLVEPLKTPLLIQTRRQGLPSPRNQDVSVVLDLMIHDIDLALMFAGGTPLTAECAGMVGPQGRLDTARAEVTFTSGAVAILDASRMAEAPRRTLKLTYASGSVEIDFLAGTLKNGTGFPLEERFADAPGVIDPLLYSLELFLDAVGGTGAPVAGVSDGVAALDLALAVEQAASE